MPSHLSWQSSRLSTFVILRYVPAIKGRMNNHGNVILIDPWDAFAENPIYMGLSVVQWVVVTKVHAPVHLLFSPVSTWVQVS